jgi:mono/diheme cytochrome c family protein
MLKQVIQLLVRVAPPPYAVAPLLAVVWAHAAAAAAPGDAAPGDAAPGAAGQVIEFNRDVRPILSDKCFACHGLDAKARKADLRLDLADSAVADRKGVRAIVPGDLAKSAAWARIITEDKDEVMPPPESHKTLSPAERETIRRWIEQGAKYQQHWSFEPIRVAAVPATTAAPVRNPIDAFVFARLDGEGLKPSPEADRATLIRRAAFALTGLPPTPAEVERFLADPSADAYEWTVDYYLSSPRFGEEMARHWLDVARYGDTHGLHLDNERQMWAYRDYVIKSFNDNKPFHRFTVEQLAGDLLPDPAKPAPTKEQLTATGFNRCNVTTSEGGSIDAEWVFRNAVDRASTTMSTWLGLTGACAVCHDHKFDPISAKDFYSFYAFFHSAADPAMDGNALLTAPTTKLAMPEQEKRMAAIDAQVAAKRKELDEKTATLAYTDPATLESRPPAEDRETVWVDDDFPAGAKVSATGHPINWVTSLAGGIPAYSGKRSIQRTDKALAQDVYEGGATLNIPPEARLFAHVFIDPKDPPKSIMLQFNRGNWEHRAVWGDADAIVWGKAGTPEKMNMGALPEAGKWVRLELPAEKVGLQPGDQLGGLALTQFGGTVAWDKVGVIGRADAAADPARSLLAWRTYRAGKDTPGVPPEINKLLKDGPASVTRPEDVKRLRDYYLQNVCADSRPQLASIAGEITKIQQQRMEAENAIPSTFIFTDLAAPRESFVMLRGQYDKPGEKVVPATPAFLPPLPKGGDGRASRLDLARWLVAPENPLTARVTVNRFWQQFFGTGLVKSSGDFGSQGEMPSHPELLDWLSANFRDGGWDVKSLVRMMVTSATFRQSAAPTPALLARDPENRLYARGPRFRLAAEQIRDNVLFVSGLMNSEMGGKGVRPYQPANIWEPVGFVGSNTQFYKQDTGDALYRRSIYTFLKRTAPPPFMANFDGPSREQTCTYREKSNTPLQALQLMNDVQHFEAARALGERMLTEGGTTPAERIAFGFRVVLSRAPDAVEAEVLAAQLAAHAARYTRDEPAARKVIAHGESKPRPQLPPAELAAYTLVANTILNLDETLNRN